ncbi:hypothetical protein CEXT_50711 [Caerostris extrusa]|uniref:Uncharacterized protein n=1 Tax=Caerostris extrusa TaxID=172846 RepID=A0AAV4UNA4_CAEEX|nr:hypothetical protein CEXT_50711 [Caerostris extrusa]
MKKRGHGTRGEGLRSPKTMTPLRFPTLCICLPWTVKKHGTETEQRILTGMDKSDTLRQSRSKSIENSFLVEKSKHGDLIKR